MVAGCRQRLLSRAPRHALTSDEEWTGVTGIGRLDLGSLGKGVESIPGASLAQRAKRWTGSPAVRRFLPTFHAGETACLLLRTRDPRRGAVRPEELLPEGTQLAAVLGSPGDGAGSLASAGCSRQAVLVGVCLLSLSRVPPGGKGRAARDPAVHLFPGPSGPAGHREACTCHRSDFLRGCVLVRTQEDLSSRDSGRQPFQVR